MSFLNFFGRDSRVQVETFPYYRDCQAFGAPVMRLPSRRNLEIFVTQNKELAGGPPSIILACTIPTEGAPSLPFLQGGVEIPKPLQQTGRFRFPFRKTARQQTVRSSFSSEEENSACIQTDRNHRCGLVAHLSALGWNHAGGDGRTSAHNSRLLAAQQPSCHEQVPALGTGQIGRRHFADGYFAEDKPNPMSAVWNHFRMGPFSFGAYRPLTSPDLLDVRVASA
jgi:hypothetical protein